MALEEKIHQLKSLCSKYKTEDFLTFIAGVLLQMPTRHENPYLKNLMSPLRQLFFLALLNLQQVDTDSKIGFSEPEWEEMSKLLVAIEMEYFYLLGFPKKGKESSEDVERIKVVMPTFMNYFFNGPLSYQEQEIEKIECIFKQFETEIHNKFELTLTDIVSFYDFINSEINKNLNEATQFFNPENWQAFTQKCIDKGLHDPKDWVKEGGDAMNAFLDFSQNPGSFLIVDLDKIEFPIISKEKTKHTFDLFSSTNVPREGIVFYTEDNILSEKPFFKIDENRYLVFSLKQFLNAAYTTFFKFCRSINERKILKNRDEFIEQKTADLFRSFFKKDFHLYTSYSIDNTAEQDILILFKQTAIIVEVKAAGYRAPLRDYNKAYEKLKSDFEKNIQYGYDQTWRVKQKFISSEKFKVFNKKKEELCEINPKRYRKAYY